MEKPKHKTMFKCLNCQKAFVGLRCSEDDSSDCANCIKACKYIYKLQRVDVGVLFQLDTGFCETCSHLLRNTYVSLQAFENLTSDRSYLYDFVSKSNMDEESEHEMVAGAECSNASEVDSEGENDMEVNETNPVLTPVVGKAVNANANNSRKILAKKLPEPDQGSGTERTQIGMSSRGRKLYSGRPVDQPIVVKQEKKMIVKREPMSVNVGRKGNGRPSFSYTQLILQAILTSPDHLRRYREIISYIVEKYAFFGGQMAPRTWEEAVQGALSTSPYFIRMPNTTDSAGKAPGRGCFWSIDGSFDRKELHNIAFGQPEGQKVQQSSQSPSPPKRNPIRIEKKPFIGGKRVELNSRRKLYKDLRERPHFSSTQLILQALLKSPDRMKRIGDIYSYIQEQYPFYASASTSKMWQGRIRTSLSLTSYFAKVPSGNIICGGPPGRGCFWSIDSSLDDTKLYKIAFGRPQPNRLTVESLGKSQLSPNRTVNATSTSDAHKHKSMPLSKKKVEEKYTRVVSEPVESFQPKIINSYSLSNSNKTGQSLESPVSTSTGSGSKPYVMKTKFFKNDTTVQTYIPGSPNNPQLKNGLQGPTTRSNSTHAPPLTSQFLKPEESAKINTLVQDVPIICEKRAAHDEDEDFKNSCLIKTKEDLFQTIFEILPDDKNSIPEGTNGLSNILLSLLTTLQEEMKQIQHHIVAFDSFFKSRNPTNLSTTLDEAINILRSLTLHSKNLFVTLDKSMVKILHLNSKKPSPSKIELCKTISLNKTVKIPIDDLAKYFKILIQVEVYLDETTYNAFWAVLETFKFRLSRLIRHFVNIDGSASESYFVNIYNYIKRNTNDKETDESETNIADHSDFLVKQSVSVWDQVRSFDHTIDVLAVNMDHSCVGIIGFQRQVDIIVAAKSKRDKQFDP